MCTLCCRSRAQCNAQELSLESSRRRHSRTRCPLFSHQSLPHQFLFQSFALHSCLVSSCFVLSYHSLECRAQLLCRAVPLLLLLPVICFEGCACTRPYIRGATHISSHCILLLHSDWLNSLHAFYCCKRRALREHSTRFCLRLVNSVLPLLLLPTEYWYGICVYFSVQHCTAHSLSTRP